MSAVQLDEMWLLLGKRDDAQPEQRKTRWLWSAIDPDTKLWLGYLIADRSLEAAQVFVHQVYGLLKTGCVPLFLSDGYKPYAIALLTHFGHWVHHVSESGRKLRDRWQPLPELTYAQVVKHRRRKRLVSVTHRVVYGTLDAVQATLKASVGKTINTAFIERLNLMVRQRVPALARRTLAAAKHEVGLEQELNLRRSYYNFVLPHGSLRQRLSESDDSARMWRHRTRNRGNAMWDSHCKPPGWTQSGMSSSCQTHWLTGLVHSRSLCRSNWNRIGKQGIKERISGMQRVNGEFMVNLSVEK